MAGACLAAHLIACLPPPATAVEIQETVLVTATRIPEDGRSLPIAWTPVSGDTIRFTGHVHINELMQQVPGAWISRGNGQESLTALRSPVLTGAGSCGAFYMASDGISLRAPGFCNVNQLFDANTEQAGRIEVIRGPATALYGSSAMHGVINVLSASPEQFPGHRLSLEGGSYDFYRLRYGYGGTQGRHGLSLRFNASSDGGYQDESGYDQQKMTLRHDYEGDVWRFVSALDVTNLDQETAGFIQGFKAYEDDDLRKTNPNPEAYRDARSLRLYTSASRDLGSNSLLTLTPYLRDNDMEFLMHFLPWKPLEENGHSSLGLRATVHTDSGPLHWVAGIDTEYTDGWLKETQDQPFSPNQPAGVHYDYQVDAWLAAAYGQLRFDLSPRWELSAGARLEYNRYEYDNRTGDGPACGPEATACRFFRPADRTDSFSDWSLNAGVSYQLGDSDRVYLRAAQGFRAPQTAELYRLQSGQERADLDSESLRNLELGLRGDRERLAYSAALFYMEKEDVIFQDADRQNVSGAETEHYGAEFSLDYAFATDWRIGLDATVARHRYANRIRLLGSSTDIKGNDIDTAPRVFGSARLEWDFLPEREARAQLEWVYMDDYYLEPDNRHQYDGHNLVNLRLESRLAGDLRGALRLTNLLDEDYAERADFGFGNYRYFVGRPRQVFVELSYSMR